MAIGRSFEGMAMGIKLFRLTHLFFVVISRRPGKRPICPKRMLRKSSGSLRIRFGSMNRGTRSHRYTSSFGIQTDLMFRSTRFWVEDNLIDSVNAKIKRLLLDNLFSGLHLTTLVFLLLLK